MTRERLVNEIAKDTHIRSDVVDIVLARFQDIAMEELANNEAFPMFGIVRVTPYVTRDKVMPSGKRIPAIRSIKFTVSENVRKLHQMQQRDFPDKPFIVNRDTWRGALKWAKDGNLGAAKRRETVLREMQEQGTDQPGWASSWLGEDF